MEADPGLAEQDRAAAVEGDDDRDGQQHRRQQDQPERGAQEIEAALRGQREGAVGSRDEREHRRAVELLDPAGRDRPVHHVHRDPDDLALLLAQPGDRVDAVPQREREADDHLVDDGGVEDGLDVVEGSEPGPSIAGRDVGVRIKEADDAEAELAMALELGGERLPPRPGAEHEYEPEVVAATSVPLEDASHRRPNEDREQRQCGEQDQQERAADVRQVQQEQHAERDQRHHHGRPDDGDGLAAEGPARSWPVEAVERQDGDPGRRVEHEERNRLGHDLA